MYTKMMNLMKAGDTLEKEYTELKAQGPPMTKAAKQHLIAEYKVSPKLKEAIMKQFRDGYQSARARDKAKLLAAGLDPSILDFSDEESETEDGPFSTP